MFLFLRGWGSKYEVVKGEMEGIREDAGFGERAQRGKDHEDVGDMEDVALGGEDPVIVG